MIEFDEIEAERERPRAKRSKGASMPRTKYFWLKITEVGNSCIPEALKGYAAWTERFCELAGISAKDNRGQILVRVQTSFVFVRFQNEEMRDNTFRTLDERGENYMEFVQESESENRNEKAAKLSKGGKSRGRGRRRGRSAKERFYFKASIGRASAKKQNTWLRMTLPKNKNFPEKLLDESIYKDRFSRNNAEVVIVRLHAAFIDVCFKREWQMKNAVTSCKNGSLTVKGIKILVSERNQKTNTVAKLGLDMALKMISETENFHGGNAKQPERPKEKGKRRLLNARETQPRRLECLAWRNVSKQNKLKSFWKWVGVQRALSLI